MNFILAIFNEFKRKVEVLLLDVSYKELHFSDIQGDQMEGESGVTQSIIDELDCWNIQRDKMER